MRQRLQELGPRVMPEDGPLGAEVIGLQAGGVHHDLALVRVDRAHRVDDGPARTGALRGDAQERRLGLGQRFRPPAQVRAPGSAPRPEQGVDEHPVEAGQVVRQRERVGAHDTDVGRAEPPDVFLELARATRVDLDRNDLGGALGKLGRLRARGGAEVEHPSPGSGNGQAGELRPDALREDQPRPERGLVHTVDVESAGNVGIGTAVDRAFAERVDADDGGSRLVLGRHQRPRVVRPEITPPHIGDPVGI